MRTVLLVAFHFPPIQSSSGLQRTLRFAQYLPEFGWKPIVLTVGAPLIDRSQASRSDANSQGYEVVRAPCLDAALHLSFRNNYPRFLALPDRWASWQWTAVPIARRIMRKRSVDALWSTYPFATAHKIGASLARTTDAPWIADFRDPMVQPGYPPNPSQKRSFEQVEALVAQRADRLVFVTPSARDVYLRRYQQRSAEDFLLLENGYDESTFTGLPPITVTQNRPPVLLHSGIVYPRERDPTALFTAIGRLARNGAIREGDFLLRFRAPVHTDLLRSTAEKHGAAPFIEIQPRLSYAEALHEMLSADALVVMQGANCNEQIPAKLYEYLRARRPILPLADPLGDTGKTLSDLGYPMVTTLESVEAIEANLPRFLSALHAGELPVAGHDEVARYSRRTLTGRLAAILDAALAERRLRGHSVARNQMPERYSG
ncbi:MAG: glycosyltransferase [Burkholderiaceae bacterium]|nr:glycosyltransferase [Burkholderiaceae bacterium]